MRYPALYDDIAPIELTDPLSNLLGSLADGQVAFTYLDVVKAAGHSCPTVAGAFLMTRAALQALYPDDHGADAVFERTDTGARVAVTYDPASVPGPAPLQEILPRLKQGTATPEDRAAFGALWQERVAAIFAAAESVVTTSP